VAQLHLNVALTANAVFQPILDGSVSAAEVDFTCSTVNIEELANRQLRHGEFDVSNLSMSTVMILASQGNTDWKLLPVFAARSFRGTQALVRKAAGIERPADLKGKRIGLPEYQMSSAMWARGFLQDEYDVRLTDVEWFMERTAENSHQTAMGFTLPAGVSLQHIPEGATLASMMVEGKLDAILWYSAQERSADGIDLGRHRDMRFLFSDQEVESTRYFNKTGIYPFNQPVVVRRTLLEEHPWLARSLYDAFGVAKDVSRSQLRRLAQPYFDTGYLPAELHPALATDLYPYGIAANRPALETAARYSYEQGLSSRLVKIEDIFAPSMLDT
jgi:4,5-dihydroxyphthalate decarboxylase